MTRPIRKPQGPPSVKRQPLTREQLRALEHYCIHCGEVGAAHGFGPPRWRTQQYLCGACLAEHGEPDR